MPSDAVTRPPRETVEGTVIAQLPSGLYQVELDGPRRVLAHLGSGTAGSGAERNFVRVLVGDRVELRLAPRDLNRGRIVRVVGR